MKKEDVEKAQKGDKESFEKIIMEIIDSLYRVAYGILENQEDASDAISNATLKAYEKIKTLRQAEFFKTWITKILINECNAIIKQKKNLVYIENYKENQENTYTNNSEITLDIKQAMKKLNKELKQIVILYYFNDLNTEKIAEMMEIPKGTVKSRLSKARQILAKELINGYKEDIG